LHVVSISNFKSLSFWKEQRSWVWLIILWICCLNQCPTPSILWSYRFPIKYLTILKPLYQFPHVVFVPPLFFMRLDLFDFATFVQFKLFFVLVILICWNYDLVSFLRCDEVCCCG
jgi:hypothetical protein